MERKNIEAAKVSIANKKELVINSVITEHVILVTQNKSDRFTFPNTFSLDNLINEIEILSEIASSYHKDKNGNSPNAITTLVTNEYLFYNKERPLSLEEFKELHYKLETIGKRFSDNLFFIFSSIPVSIPDQSTDAPASKNRFLNCVIHMQCGPSPRLTDINKAIIPPDDIRIGKDTPIGYYLDYTRPSYLPLSNKTAKFLSFFTPDNSHMTINFNHCIECESAGGAKFFRLIDICFDHGNETAKKDFIFTINELIKNNPLGPMPNQVSHVLTANSNIINQRALTVDEKKVIHADPSYEYKGPVVNNDNPSEFTKKLISKYHGMSKSENQFTLVENNRSLNITFCDSYQLERSKLIMDTINLTKLQKFSIQFFDSIDMNELSKNQQTRISRLKSAIQRMFSHEKENFETTLIEIKEKFLNSYYISRKGELSGQPSSLGDKLESFIKQFIWEDVPHTVSEDDDPPSLSDVQLKNRSIRI